MAKQDFYEILGVARTASADEIKQAYRKKARLVHPDVNKEPDAVAQFEQLQEAYDVLSDPDKRKQYDLYGHAGRVGAAGQATGPTGWHGGWAGGSPGFEHDDDDLGSVFDAFFGGHRGPGRAARGRAKPRRGEDVRIDLELSLHDIVANTTRTIRSVASGREISVTVPAGIAHGKTLRVSNEGKPAAGSGGSPGDLLVTVRIKPHPLLQRGKPQHPDPESLDVNLHLPLTLAEAVRGGKVDIPTLRGTVGLTIPPGTGCLKVFRLRERGLGSPKGAIGDLYAVAQVVVPSGEDLTPEQVSTLEEIANRGAAVRTGSAWESSS